MKFFDRLGNGWNLGIKSLEIIGEHPKLLLFPVMSGIAMILVLLSFATAFFGMAGFNPELIEGVFSKIDEMGQTVAIIIGFVFYLITYFMIVFL